MSDRKGPFISQRAIHSFLPQRQIGGIGPVGTGRLFAIASGRTLKVIHQNHFPFPKLSPAQLSWCWQDELAVSSCVSLCRQGYSYCPLGCKYKPASSSHTTYTLRLLNQFSDLMHWCVIVPPLYMVVLPYAVFWDHPVKSTVLFDTC